MIELSSGAQQQLTSNGAPKWSAVLNERYVAWLEQAGERQNTATGGTAETQLLAHVMVYDRQTGSTQRITAVPMPRDNLVLSGARLVWADKRNELDGFYIHYDLYGYDLATATERVIAGAPGAQAAPSISGDRVVWQDNRATQSRGQPLAGCENCPENRFDLYSYDWNSGDTRVLVSDGTLNSQPALYGQRLAWVKHSSWSTSDIYLLNVDSGTPRRITDTAARSIAPALSEARLVWQVPHPCDDIQLGPDGREIRPPAAVYELDLATDHVRALTGYLDVRYLVDGDTTLIDQGCMTRQSTYVLRGP